MTKSAPAATPQRPPPLSAAERQRRYRAGRGMASIDVADATSTLIKDLRLRTKQTTDALLMRALALLQAELDRPVRPARRHVAAAGRRSPISSLGASTLSQPVVPAQAVLTPMPSDNSSAADQLLVHRAAAVQLQPDLFSAQEFKRVSSAHQSTTDKKKS